MPRFAHQFCGTRFFGWRRAFIALCTTAVTLGSPAFSGLASASQAEARVTTSVVQGPHLLASSAVLVDLTTGQLLYAKNPYEHLYPASITKIMTALLALKLGRLSDPIRVSALAASQPPNKVYLVPGEVESLRQMLYGLMIDSGNDAAVAIAQRYGGSVAGFARLMNEEAWRLGARNTHFVNPNGLQNPNHYTCAYDMALIARRAMQIPEFRKIVATKYYMWRGKEWTSYLSNLNEMLWSYRGASGVKTGWTNHAQQTMVVTATRGKLSLLAVIMHVNGLQTVQQEATSLLNYGFHHYHVGTIVPKGAFLGDVGAFGHTTPLVAAQAVAGAVPNQGPPVPTTIPDWQAANANRRLCALTLVKPLRLQAIGSNRPGVVSLRITPLSSGAPAGRMIGSALVRFEGADLSVPVKTVVALPAPGQPRAPLPAWPAAILSAIAFVAYARSLAQRKKAGKRRRPKSDASPLRPYF